MTEPLNQFDIYTQQPIPSSITHETLYQEHIGEPHIHESDLLPDVWARKLNYRQKGDQLRKKWREGFK